jgi:hypothetical protein
MPPVTPPPASESVVQRPVLSLTAGRGSRLARLVPDRLPGGPDLLPWLLIPCLVLALILLTVAPADPPAGDAPGPAGVTDDGP